MSDTEVLTGPQATTAPDAGPRIEIDPESRLADIEDLYLDGTLVLVGCGKAKRDPEDPADLHLASIGPNENFGPTWTDETGPAWRAADLYTSSYFAVKRNLAELITRWVPDPGTNNLGGWAILSAEHHVLHPWEDVKYYDKRIDDIGDDPTNPDHHVENRFGLRRPDGQEIVTEMDQWAAMVAYGLASWIASFREQGALPWEVDANTLLVLAGQDYITPLRERGVFEYGIDRMTGNPNEGRGPDGRPQFPLRTRFLFEEIPAGGNGEQMAWMSDAVDQLEPLVSDRDAGEQRELGTWTGRERTCEACGVSAAEAALTDFDGAVYCAAHEPIGRCARCNAWTHENGLGNYPLCPDCQTERGGQKREPLVEEPAGRQATLADDGGSER